MAGYIGSKASVVSSGAERKKTFSITGTTTSLTGLSYTVSQVHVFHNGVRLVDGTDYTATDGSTITLTNAAENGDEVVVISYATFQTSDTVSAANGGTFAGIVDFEDNVGIGIVPETTTSTYKALELGYSTALFARTAANQSYFGNNVYHSTGWKYKTTDPAALYQQVDNQHVFFNAASGTADTTVSFSEAMRIDSSGNLLVGKTVTDASVSGVVMYSSGQTVVTQNGAPAVVMRRAGTDGSIALFRKDGTTVGSIATKTGDIYLGSDNTGLRFYDAGNAITPFNVIGAIGRDNAIDLGLSSYRFDDIYATNGTIQTSDQNEKQQIASLTDAEMEAAKAISKLFKTFKWNDSVAEKGDDARMHTGVIAQEVEQAMTDAGLNAGDYAFFISSDWVDEETGEERNRKGIRYPQLLSFIGAATEQRLASIEARLDALETA